MKVHLTFHDDIYRAGYVNIDRFPRNDRQREGDVFRLGWLLDAGEASEIVAYHVLDRIHHDRAFDVLRGWSECLAPGGVLTVVGIDLYTIVNKVAMRRMSVADANSLIFGGDDPKGRMGSISTLADVEGMLRLLGLKVVESRYEENSYVVKGERP